MQFWIDENRNCVVSYKKFLTDINNLNQIRKFVISDNPYLMLIDLVAGMLYGREMILMDADFSDNEIEELGYEPQNLDVSYVIEKRLHFNTIQDIAQRIHDSDWKLWMFTSGTTNLPKKVCHTDLSHPESVKELYFEKLRVVGRFCGLVNNAADAYDDIVTNLQLDQLELMYRVNVFSPMMLTKYVIRDMLVNGTKGSIVHISSVSAHTGYKGLAMYASSKGALESFSKGVAREWGERGIRSNVVAPGFMETGISAKLSDEQRVKIYNRTSLKKTTDVDSVADTVRFLLSNESKSITGSIIFVDNGTI